MFLSSSRQHSSSQFLPALLLSWLEPIRWIFCVLNESKTRTTFQIFFELLIFNFQLVHHSRLRKKSKQNPASSPPPPGHYIKIIIFYKIRLYKQGKSFFCLVSLDNNYDKKSLIFQLRQDGDCSGRAGSRRSIHRKIGAIRRGGKRRAHGPSAGCPSVGVGRQQKLII